MKVFLKFLKGSELLWGGVMISWWIIKMDIGFYYMMKGTKAFLIMWGLLFGLWITLLKLFW